MGSMLFLGITWTYAIAISKWFWFWYIDSCVHTRLLLSLGVTCKSAHVQSQRRLKKLWFWSINTSVYNIVSWWNINDRIQRNQRLNGPSGFAVSTHRSAQPILLLLWYYWLYEMIENGDPYLAVPHIKSVDLETVFSANCSCWDDWCFISCHFIGTVHLFRWLVFGVWPRSINKNFGLYKVDHYCIMTYRIIWNDRPERREPYLTPCYTGGISSFNSSDV